MANTIRIKRSTTTAVPSVLANAELAYSENSGKLFIGVGTGGAGGTASVIKAIGGDGAYLTLDTAQTVTGAKTFTGALNLTGATIDGFTTTGGITIGGDLTVNGTTTTINSVTVSTDDKNIELGATASPTDAGADGGGITLKGTTDKSILWYDATDSWTFNQSVELAAGLSYRIDGTQVLSKTALGSGVTGSSLTSVGTLTSGSLGTGFTTVAVAQGGTGQTSFTDGQLLIGNTGGTLSKSTLTAGTGISITNGNGSITIASTGVQFTAGDGLDLNAGTLALKLKANGGAVIESGALAVDLAASSITGTLAITDGGTGATTASGARTNLGLAIGTNVQAYDADLDTLSGMQTGAASALAALTAAEVGVIDGSTSATATTLASTDRLVINDGGAMVQVALSDLVTFFEDGTASGFDLDGGTF